MNTNFNFLADFINLFYPQIQANCGLHGFLRGDYVDKETKDYRTPKINSAFLYFARLKRVLEENKNGKTESDLNFPASVEKSGELSNYFERDLLALADYIKFY